MKIITITALVMMCVSRTTSFLTKPMRPYSSSQLSMRAKKPDLTNLFRDIEPVLKKGKSLSPDYKPRTNPQKAYVNALSKGDIPIVFGIGPAGCGKTLFACLSAIEQLKSGAIKKVILTRPIVPVEEEEIGFLPGNLAKKMDPWTRPIFDTLLEFYSQRDLDNMLQNGVIEISPLAFMRGRTFKNSFIIADEMQNSTPNQMLMLTTRIGENSKMVITGDLKQTDRSQSNGLLDIIEKVTEYQKELIPKSMSSNDSFPIKYKKDIEIVRMSERDVQRSAIVTRILDIYQYTPSKPMDFRNMDTFIKTMDNPLNKAVSSKERKEQNTAKKEEGNPLVESISKRKTVNTRSDDAAIIPKDDLPRSDK
jgi:phosphate starvation-inducible PhoH-like protein